jgi:undecaprenyl-diphosphatase
MSRPERDRTFELSVPRAIALGALHGPAELLPVSSSGHITAIPWLLGWRYDELDPELRKSFEVALHTGTAAALLIVLRNEVGEAARALDGRRLGLMLLTFAPAAGGGYALERQIERRLGTPNAVAAGLVAGAVAMALADRSPQARRHQEAGPIDALWIGLAQACALVPGVSRNGATLAAARLLGFARADANRLSRHAALPVIAGAAALKTVRLSRRGLDAQTGAAFAAGAASSFASTLVSGWLIRRLERDRSVLPYALYRVALAAAITRRRER